MKPRILVIDSDRQSHELLRDWLESEGHETILAETLEEGFINIAKPPLPRAVPLDIQLGNQNGLTLVHLGAQAASPRECADRGHVHVCFVQRVQKGGRGRLQYLFYKANRFQVSSQLSFQFARLLGQQNKYVI